MWPVLKKKVDRENKKITWKIKLGGGASDVFIRCIQS